MILLKQEEECYDASAITIQACFRGFMVQKLNNMVEDIVRFLSFPIEHAKSFELPKADQHKYLDLIGNHFFFTLLA